MAKHTLVIGTAISEWRENNNYIQTLFVGEASCDKQTSKKYQEINPTKKPQGTKLHFLKLDWDFIFISKKRVGLLQHLSF